MAQMVKYMVCIIHRWFTPYTDSFDGRITFRKKKLFFRSVALFVAPGQGPGVS